MEQSRGAMACARFHHDFSSTAPHPSIMGLDYGAKASESQAMQICKINQRLSHWHVKKRTIWLQLFITGSIGLPDSQRHHKATAIPTAIQSLRGQSSPKEISLNSRSRPIDKQRHALLRLKVHRDSVTNYLRTTDHHLIQ